MTLKCVKTDLGYKALEHSQMLAALDWGGGGEDGVILGLTVLKDSCVVLSLGNLSPYCYNSKQ